MATCNRHGDWESPKVPYPLDLMACPDCRREASIAGKEYSAAFRRWQHWEFMCGLAEEEKAASFESFRPRTRSQEEARATFLKYAQAVVERGIGGIFVYGPHGVGKTHLIASLLTYSCMKGLLGHYFSWLALSEALLASFGPHSGECREFQTALESPLLVLDELPSGQWKPWERRKLEYLADNRYRHGLPTVWSGNCKPDELEGATSMVQSRFSCRAAVVCIEGPDYRRMEEYFTIGRKRAFPRPEVPNVSITFPEYNRVLSESELLSLARLC